MLIDRKQTDNAMAKNEKDKQTINSTQDTNGQNDIKFYFTTCIKNMSSLSQEFIKRFV